MKNSNLANQDLRAEIIRHGLFLWQVARRCEVSEPTITRWMRTELAADDWRRLKILTALEGDGNGKTTKGGQ